MGVSSSPVVSLALKDKSLKKDEDEFHLHNQSFQHSSSLPSGGDTTRHRNLLLEGIVTSPSSSSSSEEGNGRYNNNYFGGDDDLELQRHMRDRQLQSWRRMLLLIVAITVHNIPEGLAVGVGFGAVGKTAAASFASARSLAIAIGIQNFPEG